MQKNTNKITLAAFLIYMATITPAFAQRQGPHAVGNMYTTALNMVAGQKVQDASGDKAITNIHINHGQVFLDITKNDSPTTMIYDPIAHKLFPDESQN